MVEYWDGETTLTHVVHPVRQKGNYILLCQNERWGGEDYIKCNRLRGWQTDKFSIKH